MRRMTEDDQVPVSLGEALRIVDTPEGRAKLKAFLESEPFPHFEAHPIVKGALVRIDRDGTRTAGRFMDRQFVRLEAEKQDLSNDK